MSNMVRFGCYEVDLSAGRLYKRGVKIGLREKSFQVLAFLLEQAGQVVSREQLRRRLWQQNVFVDFDNNLNTAIARLRQALGDRADHPRFIETLPKHGYRFLGSIVEPPAGREPLPAPRVRLLVLPFLNLSGDRAQEYFSDAMTDEMITALAAAAPEQLAVIARTTAMHYKNSHKDVARIGAELGVEYAVEGGVRRAGHRVALNVQLIQVCDQTHLFAERCEADARDIFYLQTSIARNIAARLHSLKPSATPAPRPVRAGRAAHLGEIRNLRAASVPPRPNL